MSDREDSHLQSSCAGAQVVVLGGRRGAHRRAQPAPLPVQPRSIIFRSGIERFQALYLAAQVVVLGVAEGAPSCETWTQQYHSLKTMDRQISTIVYWCTAGCAGTHTLGTARTMSCENLGDDN